MQKKLLSYWRNKIEIKELKNEIIALRRDKYGVQAVQMTGMPKGNTVSDPTQNQAERNEKINADIAKLKKRVGVLKKQQQQVLDFMKEMKPILSKLEYQVTMNKYIYGLSNNKISDDLKITKKSLDNKRYNALKKIKRCYDDKK